MIKEIALILGVSLISIILFMAPFFVALGYLKFKEKEIKNRKLFSITSCLLTYGIVLLSSLPIIPLEGINTFIAPKLHLDGYEQLAFIIHANSTNIMPGIMIFIGLAASILIPIKLKKYWICLEENKILKC
ncbi:MAG: hypothetical protein KJ990_05635 [Proteobacteria bacterium]|nr:hypothetical protein [Pseudomonadota bacterium]MBU1648537.1 hypothetical protein [Pseudomonadota bacterium]MBU1986705.1 hypothetical protein [Pseudomonadota bacterium]